jgi:uncharacterized protein
MRISTTTAKRLMLHSLGLGTPWQLSPGREGALQVVERLGYVQIDTISVVQRAHHHTVWVRHPGYEPGMLNDLVIEKRLFEHWHHAMSYLPMRDFPYHRARMGAPKGYDRKWHLENQPILDAVMDRIRDEGPLGSADFEKAVGQPTNGWWDWKPAKRALNILCDIGELMVVERRNFARIFELTERAIPAQVLNLPTSEEGEMHRYLARQTLAAHGVVSTQGIGGRSWGRQGLVSGIKDLIESGKAVRVEIEGDERRPTYALASALDEAETLPPCRAVHIISPFDSLMLWRDRVERLFGFDYKIECYTPAAKRIYGYFSLPILWGERIVGRVDCKADRKPRKLLLRHLHIEEAARDSLDGLWEPLAARLHEFAAFNACDEIVVERVTPHRLMEPLERAMASA